MSRSRSLVGSSSKQHVGTLAQGEHQLQPPALAARQQADRRALGVRVEPEALEEAGVLPVGQARRTGHRLVDVQRRIEVDAALRERAEGDGGADVARPLRRPQRPGDDLEQRRLAGPVRPDDAEPLRGSRDSSTPRNNHAPSP